MNINAIRILKFVKKKNPNVKLKKKCLILKAYVVLGQYLVLKKDEQRFKDWLKETCGANAKQQEDCYQCLKGWCDNFL